MIYDCDVCQDTGWVTCVEQDGESAYESACPDCAESVERAYTETDVETY